MIKRHNAITAMKAAKTGRTVKSKSSCSFLAVGHTAVRSNRVLITERRDMPLVGSVRSNKPHKK